MVKKSIRKTLATLYCVVIVTSRTSIINLNLPDYASSASCVATSLNRSKEARQNAQRKTSWRMPGSLNTGLWNISPFHSPLQICFVQSVQWNLSHSQQVTLVWSNECVGTHILPRWGTSQRRGGSSRGGAPEKISFSNSIALLLCCCYCCSVVIKSVYSSNFSFKF